ncbi:ArsR/SmtB family transcription factor [Ensifer sp. 4252]|uniref:ArsR/SmtB family transcription factor n=1 Tax=Ensifer sp. 4252 TaxID=3373915 RepID=UPI003D21738A
MAYEGRVLAALADPTRRAIIEKLATGGCSVADIARSLPVSQPAISQHLKVLKQAGLVHDTPSGTRRIYSIDPDGLGPLRQWLDRFWGDQLAAFKVIADRDEPG